jgi:hypothetical protein
MPEIGTGWAPTVVIMVAQSAQTKTPRMNPFERQSIRQIRQTRRPEKLPD